jgi:Protein of unknown function (DUF2905)
MNSTGWLLVILGLCAAAGAFLLLGGSVSWLGRLPGDVRIQGERGVFYFPITTCIVLSVVISALVWLVRWLSR